MAKIVGTYTCTECAREYTWEYFVRYRDGKIGYADERIKDNVIATISGSEKFENVLLETRCPYCRNIHVFEHKNPYT